MPLLRRGALVRGVAGLVLLLSALGARARGATDGGARRGRPVGVAAGAGALVAVVWLSLRLVPSRPRVAVLAAAIVGTVPLVAHVSAFAYNDALALLTVTATLAVAALAWAGARRDADRAAEPSAAQTDRSSPPAGSTRRPTGVGGCARTEHSSRPCPRPWSSR